MVGGDVSGWLAVSTMATAMCGSGACARGESGTTPRCNEPIMHDSAPNRITYEASMHGPWAGVKQSIAHGVCGVGTEPGSMNWGYQACMGYQAWRPGYAREIGNRCRSWGLTEPRGPRRSGARTTAPPTAWKSGRHPVTHTVKQPGCQSGRHSVFS